MLLYLDGEEVATERGKPKIKVATEKKKTWGKYSPVVGYFEGTGGGQNFCVQKRVHCGLMRRRGTLKLKKRKHEAKGEERIFRG